MNPPWNGEKVNLLIRVLAYFFILCATFAYGSFAYFSLTEGFTTFKGMTTSKILQSLFGAFVSVYLFLAFAKVALTGHAPKSWLPWR